MGFEIERGKEMYKYRLSKNGVSKYIGRRSVSVSVRLPEGIYNTVMQYEGRNFSEKLVNLVFDYREFYGLSKENCNTDFPEKCSTKLL